MNYNVLSLFQFSLLAEKLAQERQEIQVRKKAQEKVNPWKNITYFCEFTAFNAHGVWHKQVIYCMMNFWSEILWKIDKFWEALTFTKPSYSGALAIVLQSCNQSAVRSYVRIHQVCITEGNFFFNTNYASYWVQCPQAEPTQKSEGWFIYLSLRGQERQSMAVPNNSLIWRLFSQLIVWSIKCQKNAHHKFLKPNLTSSDVWFWPTTLDMIYVDRLIVGT